MPDSPTIETMKNKCLIVVLGMHRSGSSAITKGLEVLGVNLGSHLMSADANNQKGYFEDLEFNQLNTRVLKANGYDWNSLSAIQGDVFQDDKFIPLKNEATDLLKRKLEDTQMLGIKDPRFCRLLPFWKDVFNELQLNVSYVIILRDPENIAASLFSRDSFPRVKSLYLWLEHMIPVFQETLGCTRSVVDYEQLIADPGAVIKKLAGELGLGEQLDQQALHSYESEFIDASLKHHEKEPGSDTGFTPRLIQQLGSLLNDVSAQKTSIDSSAFNKKIKKIEEEYRDRTDILSYIDTLDSIVINKHFKLEEQTGRLDTLSAAYDKANDSLESKEKLLNKRKLKIKAFKTAIAERDDQLASLQGSLSERDAKIESFKLSVSDRDAIIDVLEQSLLDRKDHIDALELSLSARDAEIGSLEQALTERDTKIETLDLTLSERDTKIETLELTLSKRDAKVDSLEKALSERDTNIETLELTLSKRDAKVDSLEKALSGRDTKIGQFTKSVEEKNQKLAVFANQTSDLKQQIESNISDTENLAHQLDEIQSSLFWRLSIISRKFWKFFELAFMPRKERFHLIPLNELKRIRFADHSWLSTGNDPFFRLIPFSGTMPGGWKKIKTRIKTNPSDHMFKLYLDVGRGFSEANTMKIPVSPGGDVDELIHLPANLRSIRWDPTQCKGQFIQEPIIFSNVGWLNRKLKMMNRVLGVLWTTPADLKKDNVLNWKSFFTNLNRAYETTRQIIIFKNNQPG